jgi:archaeosine synthase
VVYADFMQFRIHARDGPARIGELYIDNHKIPTPSLLFIDTPRFPAPDIATIKISTKQPSQKEAVPTLIFPPGYGSLLNPVQSASSSSVSLVYPKDTPTELLLSTHPQASEKNHFYILSADKKLKKDARSKVPSLIFAVAHAFQLFEKGRPFTTFLTELRVTIGYGKLLYLPAIGDPQSMAFLSYAGVDLFDSTPAIIAARNQILLYPTGTISTKAVKELPCTCPVCSNYKRKPSDMGFNDILKHNYYALWQELLLIRHAISQGALRQLVETRVRTDPLLTAHLRFLDREHYGYLEERTAIRSSKPLLATTKDALQRPDVKRFQERLIERYRKPQNARILLLLPCSARKPYSFSQSHRLFKQCLYQLNNPSVVHEVILTSPLGVVPRELELVYPACCYDIPVTGVWDEDEQQMIRTLLSSYLQHNPYDHVVMHLPLSMQSFLRDLLEKPLSTCDEKPTAPDSLQNLTRSLRALTDTNDHSRPSDRTYENLLSLTCFQFGIPIAEHLLKGCHITGRYPHRKIMHGKTQVGMQTEKRGYLSLTLKGAASLVRFNHYTVEIDDFELQGSVFAPGVKHADPQIRIGDEVAVLQQKTLCAVGVAQMNGQEMQELDYGEAVKVRHSR